MFWLNSWFGFICLFIELVCFTVYWFCDCAGRLVAVAIEVLLMCFGFGVVGGLVWREVAVAVLVFWFWGLFDLDFGLCLGFCVCFGLCLCDGFVM